MLVLSWNLKHGRAVPGAGRHLLEEFGDALAGWEWDAALLQEVPPWWPPALALRASAQERSALTSRNALLPARRFVAIHRPDLIKSNGGGANAILVRRESITEHRVSRLGWLPERRLVHGVRLARSGLWLANLHTEARAQQAERAAQEVAEWAGAAAAVLGGDFNLRETSLPGFERAGGHGVDQIYVRGLQCGGATVALERPRLPAGEVLSDHAPVVVELPVAN